MDSKAEPIVQTEQPPSGAVEQVPQDTTPSTEVVSTQPIDDDDAVLARLLDELDSITSDEQEPPAPAPQEVTTPAPAFDRQQVTQILKRDGVPDEVIASASQETLLKWADAAAKRQKDVDSYGGRLKAMEQQLAEAGKQPQQGAQDNTPVAQPQAANADPFAKMAEIYGSDAVEPVRQAFMAQQAQMTERIVLAQTQAADAVLRIQYGAKAPAFDAVIAKMSELGTANPGGFADVNALASAAYAAIVGTKPSPATDMRAAQPTAPRGSTPPVKPQPRDEDDEVLDQILSGQRSGPRSFLRK